MTLRTWFLLIATGINLYLLGAACLMQATLYPLLGEVQTGLPAFHASLSHRLGLAFIFFEFLAAFAPLLLLSRRPGSTPLWAVWLCVGLGLTWIGMTVVWHLPAHLALSRGDASEGVMRTLLSSHAARTALQAFKCGLMLWLVARAMEPAASVAR
ncbi:MAG TPA: hypothetical protein VK447_04430 [Myxococcaceae bacterium]|nr:hypothetical protein [Myxococcaceae bacterium]